MIALLFAAATWVGTWAASPSGAAADRSFQNQTLREAVHVSIGGTQVRVRLTNRFGDAPLKIGGAAVAVRSSGARARPGTDRTLTFGGSRSIVIPPHADVYSDPVVLRVPPLSDLLIDVYLPGPTGPATQHELAFGTNYDASGNHAGGDDAAFARTGTSWYFLDGVDVAGTAARGAVVALGDSITDGAGGKRDANDRWTDFLAARLQALPENLRLGVLDAGISGNRILLSDPSYGPGALERLNDDVLSLTGVHAVMVYLGINDIQQTPHQYDAARIEQGLRQIALQLHAHGLRVVGCTITPYEGWLTYDPRGERVRQTVNAFIRRSGIFDAVVDFDAAVRDPSDPARLLPRYDSGDHLHPNAAAHRVMAAIIDLRLLYPRP